MEFRTPPKFKLPDHLTYDGTKDPREHLMSFQAHMQIFGAEDPLLCKAFLTTLIGPAQRWCMGLPAHSIGSFEQLAEQFMNTYAANIRPKRNFMHLQKTKQEHNEALRTFLIRWQKEAQTVDDLDDATLLILFMESLRVGKLYTSLHTDWPTSYADAIQRANRHADTEDAVRQKRVQEGLGRPKRQRVDEPQVGRYDRSRYGRAEGRNPVYRPQPTEVQEVQTLPPPPVLKPGDQPEKVDSGSTKYCRLHRTSTHSTEECAFLKQEMEAIIRRNAPPASNQWKRRLPWQRGGPSRTKEDGRDNEKQPAEEEANWKHKNVINMIVGGPECGDSAGSRKSWARQLYVGAVYGRGESTKKVCREPLCFTDEDLPLGTGPHRDALVIAMDITGTVVRRVLVDTGSSVNVLYMEAFEKLGLSRDSLKPVRTPLAGFTGDSIEAEGSVTLKVELGVYPHVKTLDMEFVVVRLECTHNAILGRPGLEDLGAVISLQHLCMKFRTPSGIGAVRCDQRVARECYLQACRKVGKSDFRVHTISKQEERPVERLEPAVELEEVIVDPTHPDRRAKIGKGLPEKVRESVVQVLREFKSIFAWGPEDMPGVDRSIITHRLMVDPTLKPVVQKKRHLSAERREFVKKEVDALLAAGHIREVKYPKWLANVVLVPKPPAWRMCVDYTDLNRACPKDPFPLPRIDQMVDETAGCALLSFLDAFRGYHQIFMHPADEEKTAFITPDGVYCYRVMPFGLKNSGATYTRMIARVFKDLLGKSMTAYVDDMLVKSTSETEHAVDLANSFRVMRKYNLRLNAKKCAFAVQGGKFLGYLVTQKGIEPNPEKVRAVLDMQPPTNLKELQRLTGRLAALNRFLSKSADRSLPFFDALKARKGFEWTEECQRAFEDLKQYLLSPPLLAKPREGEVLSLYLAASPKAVSSVLVREEGKAQHPIYYVSRALKAAEIRYTPLEKVVYALIITARKLTPYFQGHPIRVLTDQPLASVLRNPASSGRLIKWAMELTQFGIEYQPRPTVRAQILADFIVECTAQESEGSPGKEEPGEWWDMHVDGAASQQSCGGGVMFTTPEGFRLYYALEYQFRVSNNEAEYEAVLGGLRLAKELGASKLKIWTDSRLVEGQLKGTFETKGERLKLYKEATEGLLKELISFEISHVPRDENSEADMLSKIRMEGVPDYLVRACQKEVVTRPSVAIVSKEAPISVINVSRKRNREEVKEISAEAEWLEDLRRYKQKAELPDDPVQAAKIKRMAPLYVVERGILYKRSFGGPLLRCLFPEEADKVMDEVHRGICSAHQGAHTLARKLILQGYYWPTMVRDCLNKVAKCAICQEFSQKSTRPASFYTPVTTAIPFAKWGLDLLGPLPMAPGRHKFCIVAVDYFTKWVEAEPLVTVTEFQCRRFLWKNVICRFGIPEHLVSDNGRQFDCQPFAEFCQEFQIRHTKVSVAYPQANGQVENANRTIADGLRKKLADLGGSWVNELDRVLWAYRTTPRRATGETPFSLTFGYEAKVPAEVLEPSRRVMDYEDEANEESLRIEKNFLEERRDVALRRMAEYQRRVKAYQDRKARPRSFQEGDLVLRSRKASRPTEGGKFAKKWEGPYRVTKVIRPGTYKLETVQGQLLERTWNSYHLKKFFQ